MFRWYQEAERCYVYLPDVKSRPGARDALRESRWFTRGWTLQELIAPRKVQFFDQDGHCTGDKVMRESEISLITGIPIAVLRGQCALDDCTVEERMSWMKRRKTKKREDRVYSLLGFFDVSMPIIYGEGEARAKKRVNFEIWKNSVSDFSLTLESMHQKTTQKRIIHEMQTKLEQLEKQVAKQQSAHGQGSVLGSLLLRPLRMLAVLIDPFFFETRSTFRPENYAAELGSRMLCYSYFVTKSKSTDAVTVVHDVLFAKDNRSWICLRLHVRVPTGSQHFEMMSSHRANRSLSVRTESFPAELSLELEHALTGRSDDISHELEYEICLTQGEGALRCELPERADEGPQGILVSTVHARSRLTASLRHDGNLRIVSETDLVSIGNAQSTFFANLDGRWILYWPLYNGTAQFNRFERTIAASIDLRGAPHIAPFEGVVVDSISGLIKGGLVDLPANGPLFRLMAERRAENNPIPWPIRQKWAKQIVRAVVAYHEKRHVLGLLKTQSYRIALDEKNDVRLLTSCPRSHPNADSSGGVLAPEYRNESFTNSEGHVQAEFDLFQLGFLLWHLYRDEDHQSRYVFCKLSGCANVSSRICSEHEQPIALPPAGPDVPEYLHRIITWCRQEKPELRKSAWELLTMFPSDDIIDREICALPERSRLSNSVARQFTRLEDVQKLYGSTAICDLCSERCLGFSYDCDTCNFGNYGICRPCFDKGLHCDPTHWLSEKDDSGVWSRARSEKQVYHSCPDENGKRRTLIF